MTIQIFRMITGEDVVGEVVSFPTTPGNPHMWTIKNPVRLAVMPNKMDPNQPSVGFAPWQQFSDSDVFTFHEAHVITTTDPIKQISEQYTSLFSKIIAPVPGLILPKGK